LTNVLTEAFVLVNPTKPTSNEAAPSIYTEKRTVKYFANSIVLTLGGHLYLMSLLVARGSFRLIENMTQQTKIMIGEQL
jgi:hypothetical protein